MTVRKSSTLPFMVLLLRADLLVGGEILRHVGPDDVLGELQSHVLGQAGVGGGGGGSGGVGQGSHLTGLRLGGNRRSHGLLGLRGTLYL